MGFRAPSHVLSERFSGPSGILCARPVSSWLTNLFAKNDAELSPGPRTIRAVVVILSQKVAAAGGFALVADL